LYNEFRLLYIVGADSYPRLYCGLDKSNSYKENWRNRTPISYTLFTNMRDCYATYSRSQ